MIRKVLENIPGVEFYPIIALVLFVAFFASLIVWAIRADKAKLATLAQLPLDDNQLNAHSESSIPTSRTPQGHHYLRSGN